MADDVLLFELDGHRCAVRGADVHLVVGMVAIQQLPGAPPIVLGVINVRGDVVPVIDLRRRLGLTPRPSKLTDHLVLIRQEGRLLALPVDRVTGLETATVCEAEGTLYPTHTGGIVKLPEGLVLLYDVKDFLSSQEAGELGSALA